MTVFSLSLVWRKRARHRPDSKGKEKKKWGERIQKIFPPPTKRHRSKTFRQNFYIRKRGTFFSSGNFFFFLHFFFLLDHLHVISLMDYIPHHFVAVIPFFLFFSSCVTLLWPHQHSDGRRDNMYITDGSGHKRKRNNFFLLRKIEDDRGEEKFVDL